MADNRADALTSVHHKYRSVVLAVRRRDGGVVWQRSVCEEFPSEVVDYQGRLASSSLVTDGERVYAFFGSRGLYCLDTKGNVSWNVDLGQITTKLADVVGPCPAIFGETLIVNCDHEGQSFVTALDKRTGKERWKTDRDEPTSWATPIVVEHRGKHQVVVSGANRVRAYDLATGAVVWECRGLFANVVASPVSGDGMVYACTGYDTQMLLAIRLDDANGDITETPQVLWTRMRDTPFVSSPLLYEGGLYFLSGNRPIITCVDAKTGKDQPGTFRLAGLGEIFASPVAASGHVYITDRDGNTVVIEHGAHLRVIAWNRLDDSFTASPALSGKDLFLRGHRYLYCIAQED